MKKRNAVFLVIVFALGFIALYRNFSAPRVERVFEATPAELVEQYRQEGREVILVPYYEMNNSTWQTAENLYFYKLARTGRPEGSDREIAYLILANDGGITFEQAWEASQGDLPPEECFGGEEVEVVSVTLS